MIAFGLAAGRFRVILCAMKRAARLYDLALLGAGMLLVMIIVSGAFALWIQIIR